MTEAEWLAHETPWPMLEFLRGKASDRKLRKFALACIRPIAHRLWDEQRQTIDAMERFLDGAASAEESFVTKEMLKFGEDTEGVTLHPCVFERRAYEALFRKDAWEAADAIAGSAALVSGLEYHHAHRNDPGTDIVKNVDGQRSVVLAAQAVVLRDIVGNPFRPVTVDPAWQTATVTTLAQAIYSDRAFDRMPILADALEDAGCTNQDILGHCRGGGDHVRGCWVVDLLLGRE
jgi:hypothetical protein